MKVFPIYLAAFLLFITGSHALENIEVSPGIDRWSVKTSISNTANAKNVTLDKLLSLPLLDKQYSDVTYPDKLIPVSVGGKLKEGDIITTSGYLHLVALEKASGTNKDGDYHIQLTLNPEWSDSCFIVEIPYSEFAASSIKDKCDKGREYIRTKLLKGKEPSTGGSVMQHPVYVRVTGQLFYDAIHAKGMRGANPSYRGKRGGQPTAMHSYTAWELHPVTQIMIAKAP